MKNGPVGHLLGTSAPINPISERVAKVFFEIKPIVKWAIIKLLPWLLLLVGLVLAFVLGAPDKTGLRK